MEQVDLINKLRQDIVYLKEQKQTEVNIDVLLNHIDLLSEESKQHINESSLQKDLAIESLKHKSTASIEMFKSVIQSGQNAMKTALLINAGAAVSMLTFLTKVMTDKNTALAEKLNNSLALFVLGVLLAAFSTGTNYFTQSAYSDFRTQKWGKRANYLSILLVMASYGAFAIGAGITYKSLG